MTYSTYRLLASLLTQVVDPSTSNPSEIERTCDIPPPFSTVEHSVWAKLVRLWLEHGAPLLEGQAPRECPACGMASTRFLFMSHDGYPYNECLDCGCWYVPRRIDASLYARFYEACDEARLLADSGFTRRSSDENLAGDLERIGSYLDMLVPLLPVSKHKQRYLDIGAGTGTSLLAAQARSLDAVGLETAPRAFECAARRGVRMLDAARGFPAGPFELISLWETLEHLDDPLQTLRASASILAPHGMLAVTLPNLDSPPARIMRGDCSFLGGGSDGPGHINLFGSQQLERLFTRAGLSLLHIDGQYSTNFLELAGYLLGRHRGATDLLNGRRIQCQLPAVLVDILNSLGPALAILERQTLFSPILIAVACRRNDKLAMQSVADGLRATCERNIDEEEEKLRKGVTHIKDLAESLQREVIIRDKMLGDLQAVANEMQRELRLLRVKHPLATMIVEKARRLYSKK